MNASTQLKQQIELLHTYKSTKRPLGDFPSRSNIKNFSHIIHFVIEEAEKLIVQSQNELPDSRYNILGLSVDKIQFDSIVEQFLNDLHMFLTEQGIRTTTRIAFGQQRILSKAFFHISNSKELKLRYKEIQLDGHAISYEKFSIPFIIRITIETKLRGMIGYAQASYINKDGSRSRRDFSVSKILDALSKSKTIKSPVKFQEIKKIYEWACVFIHTGKREFIWLRLLALTILNDLFSNKNKTEHISAGIEVYSYLSPGMTLPDLEIELNKLLKKNSYELLLLEENQEDRMSFFDTFDKSYL